MSKLLEAQGLYPNIYLMMFTFSEIVTKMRNERVNIYESITITN